MRFTETRTAVFIYGFAVVLLLVTSSFLSCAKDRLSDKPYVDPKGYFKILPPAGWQVAERLGGDPIQSGSKVVLGHPALKGFLYITAVPTDVTTVDELIDRYKKAGPLNIQKTEFRGRPAVKHSYKHNGNRIFTIDFLVGSVHHKLQFTASSEFYDKYLSLATKSLETYEAIEKRK